MNLRSVSAIARPVDFKYPTNRAIAIITVATAAFELLRSLIVGAGLTASFGSAFGVALAVFLSWALCREVDPDQDNSAFLASALVLAGVYAWGRPDLIVVFWVLLSVRIINRTTGLPATIPDSFGLLGLGLWLTFTGSWSYGVLTAMAFGLNSTLPEPQKLHLRFALTAVAGALLAAIRGGLAYQDPNGLLWAAVLALGLSLSFAPVFVASATISSVGDDTNVRLSSTRVRTGQGFVLLVGVVLAFQMGSAGVVALLPLWSAVLGGSLYLLFPAKRV